MNSVKKIFSKRIAALMLSCSMLLAFTSCLDDDDSKIENVPVAYVSLYHGSPDAPDLDIEVDGRQINAYPFEYTDYTGYLRFYTGERNLRFGPYASSSIDIDTTIDFEANQLYSVFVVDEFVDAGVVVTHDNSDTPAKGKAKIRVINLSPDAGDIDFVANGDEEAWSSDLAFKESSDFMEVDAQEYDFQVRSSANNDLLLTVPDIQLQPRYFYTIIIRGYDTPPGGNPNALAAQVVVN